jgi:hypothetical protein
MSTFAKILHPHTPNLSTVIGAEVMRLMETPVPATNVARDSRAAAIEELWEVKPKANETALEWAQRNAVWFQCHAKAEYSEGFWAAVEAAGEKDFALASK